MKIGRNDLFDENKFRGSSNGEFASEFNEDLMKLKNKVMMSVKI